MCRLLTYFISHTTTAVLSANSLERAVSICAKYVHGEIYRRRGLAMVGERYYFNPNIHDGDNCWHDTTWTVGLGKDLGTLAAAGCISSIFRCDIPTIIYDVWLRMRLPLFLISYM